MDNQNYTEEYCRKGGKGGTEKVHDGKRSALGIAARITLLCWMVALLTLFLFVFLTIPQQKASFIKSLRSKANSVAVSLYDVAAGAAINDDMASVVTACQTLLRGDAEIAFLVVSREDGFSLYNQAESWKMEQKLDSAWRPKVRVPAGQIRKISQFDEEVYLFAQPFDYSGVQWGWIYVGLTLERYEADVSALYRGTMYLFLACMVASLLCAFFFSRQLVKPILSLRAIVERVAEGDLTPRVAITSNDELGSLGSSVNVMIRNLDRRNQVLESVRFIAQHFMKVHQWEDAIDEVLEKVGQALEANRVHMFMVESVEGNSMTLVQQVEWVDDKTDKIPGDKLPIVLQFENTDNNSWYQQILDGQCIMKATEKTSPANREVLQGCGVQSLIAVPFYAENNQIGLISVDDCHGMRCWNEADQDSMIAIAEILGATIVRQNSRDALQEAKNTLEERVEMRTMELQQQVAAKEQAMIELAEAQSSLVKASRTAGMAEVATGVLHNVGNVLNSVNVSCTMINEQLQKSRVGNIEKLSGLLSEHKNELETYLTKDERGRQIPEYIISLGPVLKKEQSLIKEELHSLRERIDHIKEIVTMQQSYGKVSGVYEKIMPKTLFEDALRINIEGLARHGVEILREYEEIANIEVDKNRVLQILLNLIQNAKYACSHATAEEKQIVLRLFSTEDDRVVFQVADNGIGITAENLKKIFQHGFTTRKEGHGFGLHSGALTAKELGGSLTVASEGSGCGAVFTLTLPKKREV